MSTHHHHFTMFALALTAARLVACDPSTPDCDTSSTSSSTDTTTDTSTDSTDTSTDAGQCESEIFTCVSASGSPIVCDTCPGAGLTVCTCFDAQTKVPVTCYALDAQDCAV